MALPPALLSRAHARHVGGLPGAVQLVAASRGASAASPVLASTGIEPLSLASQAEVSGIIADLAQKEIAPSKSGAQIRNFRDWLEAGFGKALTDTFMAPYNAKVR